MGPLIKRLVLAGILAAVAVGGWRMMGNLRWKTQAEWKIGGESIAYLANEERGFYTLSGLRVSEDPAQQKIPGLPQGTQTLELLQIHLGEYRDEPVGPAGLEQIREALDLRRQAGRRLILRFVYDWEGKGLQADPVSRQVVETHMKQMGTLLQDYEDLVYLVQGVFVGSWGEMHSSRYLTPKSYKSLVETLDQSMPEEIFLAVRTPAYWRMAAGRQEPLSREEAGEGETLISRLSLFNDGMMGNALDCGTYGETLREESTSLADHWTREEELAFQQELCLYLPNGGEVVLDNPWNDPPLALETLATTHVSYLNQEYDPAVLTKWKEQVYTGADALYNGISIYDYVERHLGYRYVIRQASLSPAGWNWNTPTLTLQLENVGFAPRYTPCQVELILRDSQGGETRVPLDTEVRDWVPGKTVTLGTPLNLDPGVEYEVWLSVKGTKGYPMVLFANEGITSQDTGYLLGTVKKKG